MAQILYEFAALEDGDYIHASVAKREDTFLCPGCDSLMVLRRSGKEGPNRKRPHFAHKSTADCSPESVLHLMFKEKLYRWLADGIAVGSPRNFEWKCAECRSSHQGDFLKTATSVEIEFDIGKCRPDVALISNERVTTALEVVVKNPPSDETREYYKTNAIALVEYRVAGFDELLAFEQKVKKPDYVDRCRHPNCGKCGERKQRTWMTIVELNCWRCDTPMRMAALRATSDVFGRATYFDSTLAPYSLSFSMNHRKIAEAHGVRFLFDDFRTYPYSLSSCNSCNAVVGDSYVADYLLDAATVDLCSFEIPLPFWCSECDDKPEPIKRARS